MKGEFQSHRRKYWRRADGLFFPEVLDRPPAGDQKPAATGWIWAVGAAEVVAQRHPRGSAALALGLAGAGCPSRAVPALPCASAGAAALTDHAALQREGVKLSALRLRALQRKDPMVPFGPQTRYSRRCPKFLCDFCSIIMCRSRSF